MIEVEAKIKIEDPEVYRRLLKPFSRFVGRIEKVDDYYTLQSDGKYPRKSLRVRRTGKFYEVNFKEKLSYVQGVHAKKESEFAVSDIKNFFGLINDFGFRKWLTKEKISEIYHVERNFHVEINNVKNLGWFLEIEYLTEKDVGKARKKILGVMKKLGVREREIIENGYTKMLWDKKHLLRKKN